MRTARATSPLIKLYDTKPVGILYLSLEAASSFLLISTATHNYILEAIIKLGLYYTDLPIICLNKPSPRNNLSKLPKRTRATAETQFAYWAENRDSSS